MKKRVKYDTLFLLRKVVGKRKVYRRKKWLLVKELIKKESNGTIKFWKLSVRFGKEEACQILNLHGDLYKVKTWNEITKLERNGTFVYESLPGTAVNVFRETADEVSFLR